MVRQLYDLIHNNIIIIIIIILNNNYNNEKGWVLWRNSHL